MVSAGKTAGENAMLLGKKVLPGLGDIGYKKSPANAGRTFPVLRSKRNKAYSTISF